jgi:hypothetical protein
MKFQQLGIRAFWSGALLTGLLLAVPTPARAEPQTKPETKSDSSGFDKAVTRVKQAIDEAEENGRMSRPEEQAVKELLHALGEEEREHRHHHRHEAGSFGAGFEQAGDPATTSEGSTGNSDSAGDSLGNSAGSGASNSQTGSPSAGTSTTSPPSSAPAKGTHSQNKQTQGQQGHHGRHSPFAEGLIHAHHEWREERRERRLEHAFARGLAALRSAEEHLEATEAKQAASTKGQTASTTASTRPGQNVGADPKTGERHERAWAAAHQNNSKLSESLNLAAVHPAGGKLGSTGSHGGTGVVAGQHSTTAHAPTGSTGHTPSGQHAGALAGTRHFGHKK